MRINFKRKSQFGSRMIRNCAEVEAENGARNIYSLKTTIQVAKERKLKNQLGLMCYGPLHCDYSGTLFIHFLLLFVVKY